MASSPSFVPPSEQWHRQGNSGFRSGRFADAIAAYSKAIEICPNVAVYWSNRALCYLKLKDWGNVEADCRRALELDNKSVKDHYMLGIALLEKEEFVQGATELEKAWDLERVAGVSRGYSAEIWEGLARAKFREWEQMSSERLWRLQLLKEKCENALKEQHFLGTSEFKDEQTSDLEKQVQILSDVFRKASEPDIVTNVPEYLCCPITHEIFRDPVITPSGITYERAAILDHVRQGRKFDPITRKPLHGDQMIPNLAMREAAQQYLKGHAWAYNMS